MRERLKQDGNKDPQAIAAEIDRVKQKHSARGNLTGTEGQLLDSIQAVLNRVDFDRNRYYYSRYYGHQYKSYYAEAPAAS